MPSDDDYLRTIGSIRSGDLSMLRGLLAANPGLASSRLGGIAKGRTPLHIVTDWPGYFPNGPQVARVLIDAGAEVNVRSTDDHRGETPLHWTASSDDVDVAIMLVDAGADIEAPDGSIGTPLDNAIGYGCWHVARLLVDRGAKVETLWHAAALGLLDRLQVLLRDEFLAQPEKISEAFWHACSAGRRRTAELLLRHGADLDWVPEYAKGSPLHVAKGHGTQRSNVIEWLEGLGARSFE